MLNQQDADRRDEQDLPIPVEELMPVTLGAVAGEEGITRWGPCHLDDDNTKAGGGWCGG